MASLEGHHAVVTGGGRGIGRAVARALSAAGAAVTVVGRREGALADAAAAGDAAGYVIADVTDARALRQEIERAAALRGPIAILVANAGGAQRPGDCAADAAPAAGHDRMMSLERRHRASGSGIRRIV